MVDSHLLGVTSWWLKKHNRADVMVLVTRHFRPEEVFEANKLLASVCNLPNPIKHIKSVLRSALEANVVDLVNNMEMLDKDKKDFRFSKMEKIR